MNETLGWGRSREGRGRKSRSGKIQRVMHTRPPSDEMKSRGEQVIKSKVVDLVIQR